jgi:hypothetical protein
MQDTPGKHLVGVDNAILKHIIKLNVQMQSNLIRRDVEITAEQSRLGHDPSYPSLFVWR